MKALLTAIVAMASLGCFVQKNVPALVKEAFVKSFPGIQVKKWDKEDEHYEANFVRDGKSMSASFDTAGEWLETETRIDIAELPASIVAYINEHCNGSSIKEASKLKTPNGDMYEAELKGKDLLFDTNGKFIKEEEH